jgi:hypothetical protein
MLRAGATTDIAKRLQSGTLTLGDAFAFCSGLYFRGKITYARAFAPHATFVITPTRGLQPPDLPVSADLIREFASVDISEDDARYRGPLERDLQQLTEQITADVRVVLLGSVATGKYVDVLVERLGARLHFPPSFIGRGDMSRGGLLLRHAASGIELDTRRSIRRRNVADRARRNSIRAHAFPSSNTFSCRHAIREGSNRNLETVRATMSALPS